MLITPRTKFLMAASMKTRTETGKIEGFWKSCRNIYECAERYTECISTGGPWTVPDKEGSSMCRKC